MSSSHVAVAAPDPGAGGGLGEPEQEAHPMVVDDEAPTAGDAEGSLAVSLAPTGDADVTMTEASEVVVVAVAAEVKAPTVAGGAASDPLCEIESAGMVSAEECMDEPVDGAPGLDGGVSRKEKLEAESRVFKNETDGKPVSVGDVAIPCEVVEAPSSATPEHAEAVSNKLEENYVNATSGIRKDNGVAHCDKEMQNNVITDVDGSSKIQEGDGIPTLVQQNDKSEMLLPTCDIENNGCDGTSSAENFNLCARYRLPPLDQGNFRVSNLVWGKVKSHPWWPGEIFDPSDASELALKHQKKGSHLVAYFGDNTFAWCDESQLKPFVANYSQMEKQSGSDAFVSSVNYALEELSRRILSGMSCSCLPEELSDNGMSYMVENAGLKDGVTCSAVNRSEILACFSPENLLNYIKSLALFPGQGGDLLELVIACSQLTSFYRSKGCPELASFQTGSAWVENGTDSSSTKDVTVKEVVTNEEHPPHDKPKRGRGRPRKQKPEDGLELVEKKTTSSLSNDNFYDHPAERQMAMDFDDFDGLESKKKRCLDSFEDSETKSTTTTLGSSFKIGECIRRAASQLTGSSSIVKSQNEPMAHKNTVETENGDFDVSSDDAVNELSVEKRAKRRRMYRHHIADPRELLSQLCSVAAEPMSGYSFSAMIINYFSDYRNYVVSTTTEANIVEKRTAKRGRKRKVLPSPEVETTDHMQDSYWSGLSLHNHPIHDLRRANTSMRPRRRRRSSYYHAQQNVPHGPLSPKKQIQVIERAIIHVDEKMVDECKPAALVLSFGRSSPLPSETDLIKMFGRYGPLKESETEVQTSTNTVKVVFKKRADAERAFSIAGKYSTFGPSLRSYRLVNMPFFLQSSETNNTEAQPEYHDMEIVDPSESKVPLDAAQADQVDKTDEKTEDKATVEALAGETGDVVTTSGVLDEKTGNEATAEELAETTEGETTDEVHVEGTITTEKIVEDKDLAEEITEDETSAEVHVEETIVKTKTAVHVEETTTTKKSVEVEVLAGETTEGEATAEVLIEQMTTTENTVEDDALVETTEGETTAERSVEETTTGKSIEEKTQAEETTEGETIAEPHVESIEKALVEETPEVETAAEPHVEETTTADKSLEKKTLAEKTTEDQTTAELHAEETTATDKSIEEKSLAEETTEGETTAEVHVEETTATDKSIEEKSLAEETTEGETTAEVHVEETTATDKSIEEKSLAEETTEGETTAEVHVEETTATDKSIEEKSLAEETTEGETTAEVHVEETTATDKSIEEKSLAEETTEGETTAEVCVEETTATEKAVGDKALAEETTEGETAVEVHVEESMTPDKTVEDATVEAPDEKTKTVEDANIEEPDKKSIAASTIEEGATVEAPDEKTMTSEKIVQDAVVEVGKEIAASEETVMCATVEAPAGQAGATEQAG